LSALSNWGYYSAERWRKFHWTDLIHQHHAFSVAINKKPRAGITPAISFGSTLPYAYITRSRQKKIPSLEVSTPLRIRATKGKNKEEK